MIRNTIRADKNEVSTITNIKLKSNLLSKKENKSILMIVLHLVLLMVSV